MELSAALAKALKSNVDEGRVSYGGPFSGTSYAEYGFRHVYVVAARTLLEHGVLDKIAVPCAYLQRHALELTLKSMLEPARYIPWAEDALNRNQPMTQPKPLKEHGFGKLLRRTSEALTALNYELPEEIETLAQEFAALERNDPSRWRYDFDQGGNLSFPERITLQLKDWQQRLEQIQERLNLNHASWYEEMLQQARLLDEELRERTDSSSALRNGASSE